MTPEQLSGVLVGRKRETAELERTLDRVAEGVPQAVQLTGEPGIGKSRLLAELSNLAEKRGYLVLDGRAAEFERDIPFGLIVDALNDYAGGLERAVLRALDASAVEELASILPSLSGLSEGRPTTPDGAGRYRFHYAVRALLERLARRQPVILVLDDLHWADAASLEVIAHLLRRFQGSLLIAMAFRPVPRHLAVALENLARSGSGLRLDLGPLTAEEAQGLIDPHRDAASRAALYRESGGNPFYLEQLSRVSASVVPSALGRREHHGEASSLPPPVLAAIDDELDGLPREDRLVLDAAAVAGESFEAQLIASITNRSDEQTLARLDNLLQADLIRPTIAPRRFRFRHPIVRRAVYDRIAHGSRLAAHARAAVALRAASAPLSTRAHHVERSAAVGDEQAIAELVDAAHEAAVRAPLTAGRWLLAAAALLPLAEAGQRRVSLLSEAGSALTSAGAYEESLSALEEALSLASEDRGGSRAELVAKLAYAKRRCGRPFDSRELLENALESLSPRDSPEALSMSLELALDQLWHGEITPMHQRASEVASIAHERADIAMTSIAAALISLAHSASDRIAEARAELAEALEAHAALTDEQLAERVYLSFYVGLAALRLEQADDALTCVHRGIDVARATGQEATVTPWPAIAARALLLKGQVNEAARIAETAIDAASLSANDWRTVWALEAVALTAYWAGNTDRALVAADELMNRAERVHPFLCGRARIQRAGALYATGDPERAVAELAALDAGRDSRLLDQNAAFGREVLIRACLARGDLDGASDAAARAYDRSEASKLPQQGATVRCALAAVRLHCGDAQAATRTCEEALEIARSAGNPLLSARARACMGTALVAAGDARRGIAELEQAQRALLACGAAREADVAARELRRLGRRVPRRAGVSGNELSGLSPREREVADHVVAGKTNREIAATLFLSEKTIETHLAHIYSKLGVKSRARLAAILARQTVG